MLDSWQSLCVAPSNNYLCTYRQLRSESVKTSSRSRVIGEISNVPEPAITSEKVYKECSARALKLVSVLLLIFVVLSIPFHLTRRPLRQQQLAMWRNLQTVFLSLPIPQEKRSPYHNKSAVYISPFRISIRLPQSLLSKCCQYCRGTLPSSAIINSTIKPNTAAIASHWV